MLLLLLLLLLPQLDSPQFHAHTIPMIINDSIQKVDKKVKSKKLNTNSSDHVNAKLNVKKKICKNSILVMGNSHTRVCSARLKDKLNNAFNVMGIVRLGTCINTLTSMVKCRMANLTESDAIVLGGGTNDVSHNLQEGLKH
jgi:hypothetical protein